VFNQDITFSNQILEIDRQLHINPDFEVISGFSILKVYANLSLAKILAISLVASLVLGFLMLGIYRFDRILANYPNRV
jgi:hypothetical protein